MDFPDTNTLCNMYGRKQETRRRLPNRTKKLLPTIERSPSVPLQQGTSDIPTAAESSPCISDGDANIAQAAAISGRNPPTPKTGETFTPNAIEPHMGRVGTRISTPARQSSGLPAIATEHHTSAEFPLATTFSRVKVEPYTLRYANNSSSAHRTPDQYDDARGGALGSQIFTPRTQRRRLENNGMLEQRKEDYGLEVIESTRRQLKTIETLLREIGSVQKTRDEEKARKKCSKSRKKARSALKEQSMTEKNDDPHSDSATDVCTATHDVSSEQQSTLDQLQGQDDIVSLGGATVVTEKVKPVPEGGPMAPSGHVRVVDGAEPNPCDDKNEDTGIWMKSCSGKGKTNAIRFQDEGCLADRDANTPTPAQSVRRPIDREQLGAQSSTGGPSGASAGPSNTDRSLGHRAWTNSGPVRIHKGLQSSVRRPWCHPFAKREVILPNKRPKCICISLHWYFHQTWVSKPQIAKFPGCKAEFLAHVAQIVKCPAHPSYVKLECQRILLEDNQTSLAGLKAQFQIEPHR